MIMSKRNRRAKNSTNNNKFKGNGQHPMNTDAAGNSAKALTLRNTSGFEQRHVHGRDAEKGANDVSWYNHIYSVSDPLSRVSYNIMTGSKYDPLNKHAVSPYSGAGTWEVSADRIGVVDPGIMTLSVQTVLGDEHAANVAATQLYSLVRQANSGAKNYDKTDLMMMVMAMDNAYMVYEYLLRAFRVCKSWDYLNRYTPEIILASMGFSTEILSDLANFEALLNLFAYRLSAMCVPDQFDFIHRHSWLFSNIYEDENNGRSQMYILHPRKFYIWTEGADDEPTKLVAHNLQDLYTPATVGYAGIRNMSQVQEIMDNVLSPLFGSEDVGLMNGDLIKAFGDGGMIKINPADTTPLVPVHNDEVLEQIMNADVLANTAQVTFDNLDIVQDLSSLAAGPQLSQDLTYTAVSGQAPRNAVKSLLNAYDDLSSDRVITSTRFKFTTETIPGGSGATANKEKITSCGTEIIVSATLWFKDGLAGDFKYFQPRSMMNSASMQVLSLASRFRYCPTIYLFNSMNNAWVYYGYIQDSCTTAWLDDEWIKKMNEVAVMSEYAAKDFKTGLS